MSSIFLPQATLVTAHTPLSSDEHLAVYISTQAKICVLRRKGARLSTPCQVTGSASWDRNWPWYHDRKLEWKLEFSLWL